MLLFKIVPRVGGRSIRSFDPRYGIFIALSGKRVEKTKAEWQAQNGGRGRLILPATTEMSTSRFQNDWECGLAAGHDTYK